MCEADSHLMATNTWHRFLLHRAASFLATQGQMLKCHCWLLGGLACRDQLKCDGTRTETRFRLSAKQTSPFKLVGASVQSTTGSRGVHISGSDARYTKFWGSVESTGYPLHSPVSPSLPLPCVVCHHISTGVYHLPPMCRIHVRDRINLLALDCYLIIWNFLVLQLFKRIV